MVTYSQRRNCQRRSTFTLKLFLIHIPVDRFHLVQKTGQVCTALAFNPHRTSEFLVALPDNSIRCFDKGRIRWALESWLCFVSASVPPDDGLLRLRRTLPLRLKAAGELDEGSRRSSFVHLHPQLWSICRQHFPGRCPPLGPGHLSENKEAHDQAVCRHPEGKYLTLRSGILQTAT